MKAIAYDFYNLNAKTFAEPPGPYGSKTCYPRGDCLYGKQQRWHSGPTAYKDFP